MSDMKTCAKCGGALLYYGANGYGGKTCHCNLSIFELSAKKDEKIAELKKQVAELLQAQASEPVAWRLKDGNTYFYYEKVNKEGVLFESMEALYTSPPNTQPHNPAVYTDNSVVIANMQANLNKAREALNKIANPETINGYNDASIYRNISQTTLKEIE